MITSLLPLVERLSGRRSWSEMRRLRELQWLPVDVLENQTLEKARRIVTYAGTHVPHYRELFAHHRFDPQSIRTLDDLSQVPITTKADLRSGFPKRTVAENVPRSRAAEGSTSGSTGSPFRFYTDRASEAIRHGSYLFFLDLAGVSIADTRVAIGYHTRSPRPPIMRDLARRVVLGERSILLSALDLTPDSFRAAVQRLPRGRRYFLQAYPSYASHLAAGLLGDGDPLERLPCAVITSSETLSDLDVRILTRAFRCPIINHYSTWEVLHVAQSCPDHPELLHINSRRAVLRIVRDDGTAAAPGEQGRVLLTDLTNFVMPFINYDIGDRAIAGRPCPCGRGLPTLHALEGRVGEIIRTPDGKLIAPGSLTRRLTRLVLDLVWEYQAVQTAAEAVTLRVVPAPRFSAADAVSLRRDLEEFLGPGVRVTVEPVDRIIPEASGKRLIIKSLPNPSPGSERGRDLLGL